MKTLKMFLFTLVFASISFAGFAQEKSETIKVSGECGMCQKKIEKAATAAGASFASWSSETKVLDLKYDAKQTDRTKIQQAIAKAGYDTQDVKATDEAYDKLHGCCKYDRTASTDSNDAKSHSCCADDKCQKSDCHKDGGKCTKDMACCKESGCDKKDCCKKA